MNDTRVEAATKALRDFTGDCTCDEAYTGRDLIDPQCIYHYVPNEEAANDTLAAADRADREAGIHRVRVDYSTVERVARVLFAQRDVGGSGFGAWDDQEQGPSDEEKGWFLDDARAVLAALTGAES